MVVEAEQCISIENESCAVVIDRDNGSIVRILDKKSSLEALSEPRLAESFRVLIPVPEKEGNYVYGKEQTLTSYRLVENGIILGWAGPMVNDLGSFHLAVTLTIMLLEDEVQFDTIVDNQTGYRLAEIWCPILGGITGLGERKKTQAMIPVAVGSVQEDLFTNFRGTVELGVPVPEYLYSYPGNLSMQWIDFYNTSENRGMYFSCQDTLARYKVLRFELQPGIGHGRRDTWPSLREIGPEIPVGILMNWVFFPYTQSGELFAAPKIVLRFHHGDWHDAALYYREWFGANFKAVEKDTWMRQETAFMNTMFMLPEGNVQFKFADITKWAESAKKSGINSVLISGWDKGGHDNHYPYYEVEPKLGTLEDLRRGIAEIHRLGMKVFFFINVQPVDCNTEWFKEELYQYSITDPWGNTSPLGWGMGTVAARLNLTSRKMFTADPSFPEFRKLLIDQFVKLVEIGADGLHIDKLSWALPGFSLNFSPEIEKLGLSPDISTWQGQLTFCHELVAECRKHNPEFCISIEGSWDQMIQYTENTWLWHNPWASDHTCALKYTFPQWTPCYAASQPFDYVIVNDAVRFGYQLFIGPMMYTDSMAAKPMKGLGEYIKEAIRIREELKETIYHGVFLDKQQVTVEKRTEYVFYNTHLNPVTGKRACVLTNADDVAHEVRAYFDGSVDGDVLIYEPFSEKKRKHLPVTVTIPSQRFVVLLEV